MIIIKSLLWLCYYCFSLVSRITRWNTISAVYLPRAPIIYAHLRIPIYYYYTRVLCRSGRHRRRLRFATRFADVILSCAVCYYNVGRSALRARRVHVRRDRSDVVKTQKRNKNPVKKCRLKRFSRQYQDGRRLYCFY